MANTARLDAINLFKNDFRADPYYADAFKTFEYTVTTTTGSPYGGGTTTTTDYSAQCLEVGGSSKQKAVQITGSIRSTDIMIKGLVDEITPPAIGKPFVFGGKQLTVQSLEFDSVNAVFTLFGRGS